MQDEIVPNENIRQEYSIVFSNSLSTLNDLSSFLFFMLFLHLCDCAGVYVCYGISKGI